MTELPDEFDSKREMDGWLEENIMGNDVCYKPPSKCHIRCDKYALKIPAPNSNSRVHEPERFKVDMVSFYTKKRRSSLDLLEEFCNRYTIEALPNPIDDSEDLQRVLVEKDGIRAETHKKELPLAISTSIYKAHQKLNKEETDENDED